MYMSRAYLQIFNTLHLCAVAFSRSVMHMKYSEFCKFKIPMMVAALKCKINAESESPYRSGFRGGGNRLHTSLSSTEASEFRHCDMRQHLFHDNVNSYCICFPVSLRRTVSKVSVLATWCIDPSFLTLHLHQQRDSLKLSHKTFASTNTLTTEQNTTKSLYVRYT